LRGWSLLPRATLAGEAKVAGRGLPAFATLQLPENTVLRLRHGTGNSVCALAGSSLPYAVAANLYLVKCIRRQTARAGMTQAAHQLLMSAASLHLTSTPQRRVTNTFRLNARLPLLVSVAPSSLLEGASSTDSPSCSRGLRQLSRQPSAPPTGHSAASTGLVMPPKTGKGSTFLQASERQSS
jgi:hypothetical protein